MQTNSIRRWVVVLSAALLFFYSFMQLNILNPISAILMREFSINSTQLGNLSAMYFYLNAILLLPAGLLLDRFSVKKMILFAICMGILGTFCFALSPDAFLASVSRAVVGVSGAFCFVGPMCLAARWFPPKQLALIAGSLITMCMLGGLVAQTPMTLMVHAYGWRTAMMIDGCLGILFFIIILIFVKDFPSEEAKRAKQTAERMPFLRSLKAVLFSPFNWLCGLFTALVNLPIFLLGALWGVLYLMEVVNLSAAKASYVTSMLFIGTIFGSPLIGLLSDRIHKRRLFMMSTAVVALLLMLIIIYATNLSFWSLMILFFLLGFVAGSQSLSYSLVTEYNPASVTGCANSIVSIVLVMSGFVFQPFFGWLMSLHDKPYVLQHVVHYSKTDFRYGMLIMPVTFGLSFIIALCIREAAKKREKMLNNT